MTRTRDYVLTTWMKGIITIIKANLGRMATKILLEGPPGASKTSFGEFLAQHLHARYFELNFTSSMRAEEVLYAIAVAPGNQVVYRKSALWEAFEASHEGPVVLVLDEIDKARERVEELLLRTLERYRFQDPWGNTVHGRQENLVVIATSNRKRELMEPTLRRLPIRLQIGFPDWATQREIITACLPEGFSISQQALDLLVRIATLLREADPNKAPSYQELAHLAWNAYCLFEAGMFDQDVRQVLEGGLWKNGDFPGLPFNWVKALRKELRVVSSSKEVAIKTSS
jgi:MoxR-like ATPase